jgi:hypothetical protein
VGVDGIHLKVRRGQDKVCLLVVIGVRADGRKDLVAATPTPWAVGATHHLNPHRRWTVATKIDRH